MRHRARFVMERPGESPAFDLQAVTVHNAVTCSSKSSKNLDSCYQSASEMAGIGRRYFSEIIIVDNTKIYFLTTHGFFSDGKSMHLRNNGRFYLTTVLNCRP